MFHRYGLLVAILIAYPLSNAHAQTPWQPKTSNTTASLGDVHFVDPNNVWAVGGLATVRFSTDGGETWNTRTLSVATDQCCNSVRFVDASTVWIGGLRSVLRSTDGGANFGGVAFTGTSGTYRNRLFPVSQTVAWAAGGTSLAGQPAIGHFRYTFAQDNSVTTQTWFTVATINDLLNAIFFVDPDNGWSIGSRGRITRITNGTAGTPTFTPQTSGTTEALHDICMRSLTLGWIVGANGTILKTIDGTNWNPIASPTANRLQSVYFVNDQVGLIAGDGGTILVSIDGGETWQPENSGVTTELRGAFFSGVVGYAVGAAGTILERDSASLFEGIMPSSGPAAGGQSVTITGTNLSGATSVTFGGTPGVITANSATSITVTTPAHAAGPVDVVVTTTGGSATATNGYTFLEAPTIGSITPNLGPATGGQSVTVNGTDLSGATIIIGGNAATVTETTATTATFTTPAHAAGAVDVTVTTAGGSATATNGYTYEAMAMRGDANGDTAITASDIFYLINNLFAGGPDPIGSGDANSDSVVTASDIFYLINHLFAGGPAPG